MAVRFVALAGVVAVLSACTGAGAGPTDGADGSPQMLDLSQLDVRRVATGSSGADELDEWNSEVQPYRAYHESLVLMWWADDILAVLTDWTETQPSSYAHAETSLDVSWGTDKTTWWWDVTGGELDYRAEISDDEGDFLLVVYASGEKKLEGTIAPDGSTGTLRISDLWAGDEDRVSHFSWKPSTKPDYDWHISIVFNDYDDDIEETMEIWTTEDGSEGEYSGSVSGDQYELITWGQ